MLTTWLECHCRDTFSARIQRIPSLSPGPPGSRPYRLPSRRQAANVNCFRRCFSAKRNLRKIASASSKPALDSRGILFVTGLLGLELLRDHYKPGGDLASGLVTRKYWPFFGSMRLPLL